MHFGSDEMRDLLLETVKNPEKSRHVLGVVLDVVEQYTMSKLNSGVSKRTGDEVVSVNILQLTEQDKEDICQIVLCNVVKSLDKFIRNLEDDTYTEKQRQAWLKVIVFNVTSAYLKKENRYKKLFDVFTDLDTLDKIGDETSIIRVEDDASYKLLVKGLIRLACRAKSKPEKILVYLYNVVVFRELAARAKNNSSSLTSEYMSRRSWFNLKLRFIEILDKVFDVQLDETETERFDVAFGCDVPSAAGKTICAVTPKIVADWTNRMKDYIFKHSSELGYNGGNFNDKK